MKILYIDVIVNSIMLVVYLNNCICISHIKLNLGYLYLLLAHLITRLSLALWEWWEWCRAWIFLCHGFSMLSQLFGNWFKLCLVLENLQRMQILTWFLIKLKLVCGTDLVKLRCWTLNRVPFLVTYLFSSVYKEL